MLEAGYMAIPFDGSFLIDNQEIPEMEALRAKEYPDLPFHQPGGKQVQIFLSEYSLNTLMISSHIQNLLSLSEEVSPVFPSSFSQRLSKYLETRMKMILKMHSIRLNLSLEQINKWEHQL